MSPALLVTLLLAGGAASPYGILRTGPFHGDEVRGRTGGAWLGLFPGALRSVRVVARVVRDPLLDGDEGAVAPTGLEVTTADGAPPALLVRGLRPRAVVPLLSGPGALSAPGERVALPMPGAPAVLAHERREGGGDRLVLRAGGAAQVLVDQGPDGDCDSWALLWAGDLDGDGKLDLVLSASSHYNLETTRLLLSSEAGRGELLREVATFGTTGC